MKKITNYINKTFLTIIAIGLTASGCGDFLDINKDPNNPSDTRVGLLLPTIETVIFEALGNGSGGLSDLTSQFVHQTVQRNNANIYLVTGNEFSLGNAWPNLYAGALQDINQMMNKASETSSWHYLGVSQVLKAYTYSIMIDVWDKVVYNEFGQGVKNPYPKFDNGEDIYPKLFELLDEAVVNLKKDTKEALGTDDLVYGFKGDAAALSWIKLANSLKLKLYNTVRKTDLYKADAVQAIITTDSLMNAVDTGFRLKYGLSSNPENRHPMFVQDYVQHNSNYIDPYFYLIMKGNFEDYVGAVWNPVLEGIENDPRIPYYFYNQLNSEEAPQNAPTTAYFDNFLSIWSLSLNIDPNEGFDQAYSQTLPGLYPAGGAFDDGSGTTGGAAEKEVPGLVGGDGYTRLFSYFSYLYTRAELSLTMSAPGDARDFFEMALNASFDEVNEIAGVNKISDDDIKDYTDLVLARYDAASDQGKLELILTEKWIASFGFSIDTYSDYRRTGYPVLFNADTDNNPYTIKSRNYPVSLPYYINDLQINPNAPAQRNPGTDKVFWDVD